MSKPELDTLLEIKENPSTTQRSLSHKLNISLGLTNAILKNLIKRGWIKAQKLTGRKILYLITPKGMARVTNLVYDRFCETQHYYQHTKSLITAYLDKLYQEGIRKAAIYGTNQLSELTYLALLDSPIKLHSIITDKRAPTQKRFLGQEVLTISDFTQKYSENLSSTSQKDIVILSTISLNKFLLEIKNHKNFTSNLKMVNLEDILRNLKT